VQQLLLMLPMLNRISFSPRGLELLLLLL